MQLDNGLQMYINDINAKIRNRPKNKIIRNIKNIFKSVSSFFSESHNGNDFTFNIDKLIRKIASAKKKDGYISRSVRNIKYEVLKNGIYFISNKEKNAELIKQDFENLILNSNETLSTFFEESSNNLISYSNLYIYKKINKRKGKIESIKILPSVGWDANKYIGNEVLEWKFQNSDKPLTYKNIIHITYNKETHELFGTPFVTSSIEDAQILRRIENAGASSYINSRFKKVIAYVGNEEYPGGSREIKDVTEILEKVGDGDLVMSGKVKMDLFGPEYEDPSNLITGFRERLFSGIGSSASEMGISGNSGRQDAESQKEQTKTISEDFQNCFESQLTNTIVRELCLERFGEFNSENKVELRFKDTFTNQERKEKHSVHLWQANAITTKEMRKDINRNESYEKKDTFFEQFGKSKDGAVENKSNPENQHGKTGTTKPTKKD